MAYGFDRFLTTHTGSLPRPDDLIRRMFAKEEGVPPRALCGSTPIGIASMPMQPSGAASSGGCSTATGARKGGKGMTDTASDANFEKTYLDHVTEQLQRLQRYADRNRLRFLWLRGALVVFSASLPALTGMGFSGVATFWAVIVAILASGEAQLQPGERWQRGSSRCPRFVNI